MPTGRVAWACGAAVVAWTVLTVATEPWPDGPTHEVSITKYGSLQLPREGEPTPPPTVRVLRAASGNCEVNLALGENHQVRPGSLVLLQSMADGPNVAVAEILLTRPEDSDARLAGYWADCPRVYEVKRADCPAAADTVAATRPRADRLGPEEAKRWARDLDSITSRRGCDGWTPPPERERIPGIDDY